MSLFERLKKDGFTATRLEELRVAPHVPQMSEIGEIQESELRSYIRTSKLAMGRSRPCPGIPMTDFNPKPGTLSRSDFFLA